jgi:hypothetical protein
MSADPNLEPSIPLPDSGTTPWMITQSQDIYNNIKQLLNDRLKLKQFADEGFEYALKNYSRNSSSNRLRDSLASHGFDVENPLNE